MIVACQWNTAKESEWAVSIGNLATVVFKYSQSSPTGPAEHCAGGSLPRSCNSLKTIKHVRIPWNRCQVNNRHLKVRGLIWRGYTKRVTRNVWEMLRGRIFGCSPPKDIINRNRADYVVSGIFLRSSLFQFAVVSAIACGRFRRISTGKTRRNVPKHTWIASHPYSVAKSLRAFNWHKNTTSRRILTFSTQTTETTDPNIPY